MGRGKATLLGLVSLAFVVGGVYIWQTAHDPMGLVCIVFFGAGVVLSFFALVNVGPVIGKILFLLTGFGLTAGCAITAYSVFLTNKDYSSHRYPQPVIGVASVLGILLFGYGCLAIIFPQLRLRGPRARLQDPHEDQPKDEQVGGPQHDIDVPPSTDQK